MPYELSVDNAALFDGTVRGNRVVRPIGHRSELGRHFRGCGCDYFAAAADTSFRRFGRPDHITS
ncbi:hypothetical protein ACFPM0_11480 [Pseudonocardia sulfidoxydans]|uniref:hypothetical protein n=1 Tax=Pseudonocardia sulfidoxydans TaxID=54011 RepID=UPI0036203381